MITLIQKLTTALVVVLLSTYALFAGDGLKMQTQTKDLTNGKVISSTLYINSSELVIKNGNHVILFDASKELITYIDHKSKQYSKIDKATMKMLGQQLEQMAAMIKAFYSNMPPEQQEKFRPLIEGEVNASYEKTGSERVSAWNTNKYKATASGKMVLETNIAGFSTLDISKTDVQALPKLLDLIADNLSGIGAVVPATSVISQWGGKDNPIFKEGVPVKTTTFSNGKPQNETLVDTIEKTSFSLKDFAVPQGYQEQKVEFDANSMR